MQKWRCSQSSCKWTNHSNIEKQISGKIHLDLIKVQAEYGANNSYRKSSKNLECITGKRSVNNHMRIRKSTCDTGEILSGYHAELTERTIKKQQNKEVKKSQCKQQNILAANELCAVVDGGHVHDADNPGHNFEAMMGKIFAPINVIRIDKTHSKITKKHCAGSGKYDKQKTMKEQMAIAAIKEGIDKNKTRVVALADGAKNCWNILESLKPLCFIIIYILDWFHIGKYIQNIKTSMPGNSDKVAEIKSLLWHGNSSEALLKIKSLSSSLTNEKEKQTIDKFHEYIFSNKEHIVNYSERKKKMLPYTSHVAESTVEHMLNERCKRKQKMQWSREGLHSVIQIRASQASNEWINDWETIIQPRLASA
jgi:hypothetical protein